MADEQTLQGPPSHLASGSRGRAQMIAPYQPHGFTKGKLMILPPRRKFHLKFFASNDVPGERYQGLSVPAKTHKISKEKQRKHPNKDTLRAQILKKTILFEICNFV